MNTLPAPDSARVDIEYRTFAGMLAIRLVGPARDSATVLLHGGQLVSWVNAQGQEMLRDGSASQPAVLQARGGGPTVAFPGLVHSDPVSYRALTHNAEWRMDDAWFHRGVPNLQLRLRSSESKCQNWAHAFDCYLHLALESPALQLTLKVVNTGHRVMQFNAALHPCFRVAAAVPGAEPVAQDWRTTHAPCVSGIAPASALRLPSAGGWVEICHAGFADVGVWSPPVGAGHAADQAEYVCVEASTSQQPVQLGPGAHWLATQEMRWTPALR